VFVVEGRLPVGRLVAHQQAGGRYRVASLLVADNQVQAMAGPIDVLTAAGVAVYVASREVLAATVGFNLHRGVVAIGRRPKPLTPAEVVAGATSGRRGVIAVLEGINDQENLGAIFRGAAAFGLAGILLDPTTADPLYRRSVRVSVGHVLDVPFARLDRWPEGIADLRAAGIVIAALSPPRADLSPEHPSPRPAELPGPEASVAVVIGAEGPGLADATLAAADLTIAIPMAHGVDSLNVAAASAIAFHQLSGQGLDVGR
jgi:tRNA G18 (ribose-2'-O)-methylase SpoU